eukprot:m.312801 g.312801  ORF g.312801 m.312801 type:complete len:595 (+) comp20245_c0_seq1:269-2053(+)
MQLPHCNADESSLAQHNNALCRLCVGHDKSATVSGHRHVHITEPNHDSFRFSDSWLSTDAGQIMKEEHRYRFGRRAWELEYKSIHERELFSKNDPVEFMFVENVEVERARALRFGLRDLPSFLKKFSSEDDPESLQEDLDELEFEAECLQAEFGTAANPVDRAAILSTCGKDLKYRPNLASRMSEDEQVKCESAIHEESDVADHPNAVWKCPTCHVALCAPCNALCHGIVKPSSSTDANDTNGSARRPSTRTNVRVKWHEPLEVTGTPYTRLVLPDDYVLRPRAVVVEEYQASGDDDEYEPEYYTEEDSTEDEEDEDDTTVQDAGGEEDSGPPPIVAPYQPPEAVPDISPEEPRQRPARPAPPPPAKRGSASRATPPTPPPLTTTPHIPVATPPPPAAKPPLPTKPRRLSTETSPARTPDLPGTPTNEGGTKPPVVSPWAGTAPGTKPRPPRPSTLPAKPKVAAKPPTLLKMAHKRVVKPMPNRKPTMLRDTNYRPAKRGSASGTTAPVLPPVTPIFAPSAQDPNAFRRRTDSETVKLRRLESAASVSDAAAAARARFKLKAMKARLATRVETDEARVILQEMHEQQSNKETTS